MARRVIKGTARSRRAEERKEEKVGGNSRKYVNAVRCASYNAHHAPALVWPRVACLHVSFHQTAKKKELKRQKPQCIHSVRHFCIPTTCLLRSALPTPIVPSIRSPGTQFRNLPAYSVRFPFNSWPCDFLGSLSPHSTPSPHPVMHRAMFSRSFTSCLPTGWPSSYIQSRKQVASPFMQWQNGSMCCSPFHPLMYTCILGASVFCCPMKYSVMPEYHPFVAGRLLQDFGRNV